MQPLAIVSQHNGEKGANHLAESGSRKSSHGGSNFTYMSTPTKSIRSEAIGHEVNRVIDGTSASANLADPYEESKHQATASAFKLHQHGAQSEEKPQLFNSTPAKYQNAKRGAP